MKEETTNTTQQAAVMIDAEGKEIHPSPASFGEAAAHGAKEAGNAARAFLPKLKAAGTKVGYGMAFGVGFGGGFAATLAKELVPQLLKNGAADGLRSGSDKARDLFTPGEQSAPADIDYAMS